MKKIINIQTLFIIFDVILIIVVSLFFHLQRPISTTKVVYLPKGNISEIIAYLDKHNFDISKTFDKYIIASIGKPQAGWINIGKTHLSKGDFLYQLTKAKAATETFTIIPGQTTYIILKNLAQTFNLSYAVLQATYDYFAPYKEGVFIPETYHIPRGIGEVHLIRYLILLSDEAYKSMSHKIFGVYEKEKWYKYLIIASIIQKEAGNIKEMPLVSSVIYNRLNKGMKLQMDGTLNYGKYAHTKVTPQRIREDTSKYNTYKYEGLPPTPISVVSIEAIKAAIFPKKSNFLYFVRDKRDKEGGHIFTKSLAAHNRAIKQQR